MVNDKYKYSFLRSHKLTKYKVVLIHLIQNFYGDHWPIKWLCLHSLGTPIVEDFLRIE